MRAPPKIYITTRTHAQIQQLVAELRRTKYMDNLKMAILASRKQLCINKTIKPLFDRNEQCKKALEMKDCAFYQHRQAMEKHFRHQPQQENQNQNENSNAKQKKKNSNVFDIEDMVDYGQSHRVCPYYGSHITCETANIVFCPYNYILDPVIRHSMSIPIRNNIVIVDEAHNVEDCCRGALSKKYFVSDFELCEHELHSLCKNKVCKKDADVFEAVGAILEVIKRVREWCLEIIRTFTTNDFKMLRNSWPNPHLPRNNPKNTLQYILDEKCSVNKGNVYALEKYALQMFQFLDGLKDQQSKYQQQMEDHRQQQPAQPPQHQHSGHTHKHNTRHRNRSKNARNGKAMPSSNGISFGDNNNNNNNNNNKENERESNNANMAATKTKNGSSDSSRATSTSTSATDVADYFFKLSSKSSAVIEYLFSVIFPKIFKHQNEFHIVILPQYKSASNYQTSTNNRRNGLSQIKDTSINFWCMSPKVAFREIGEKCHSVILTSGTLSPIKAMEYELGVHFPIQMTANHVIDKGQVLITSIARGVRFNNILKLDHSGLKQPQIKLEIGLSLIQLFKHIPQGILVFFPSYATMNSLIECWTTSSLKVFAQLSHLKKLYIEPRGSDDDATQLFLKKIDEFGRQCGNVKYKAKYQRQQQRKHTRYKKWQKKKAKQKIAHTNAKMSVFGKYGFVRPSAAKNSNEGESDSKVQSDSSQTQTEDIDVDVEIIDKSDNNAESRVEGQTVKGAAFFGVCRGKISEGIDFSGPMSRAVILIGIPYPNNKEPEINFKKKYNEYNLLLEQQKIWKSQTEAQAQALALAQKAAPGTAHAQKNQPAQSAMLTYSLRGSQWYNLQAFRALNQALGRCIRHRFDFGAIIFLDARFSDAGKSRNIAKLSQWVQPWFVINKQYPNSVQNCVEHEIKPFFKYIEKQPPQKNWIPPPFLVSMINNGMRNPNNNNTQPARHVYNNHTHNHNRYQNKSVRTVRRFQPQPQPQMQSQSKSNRTPGNTRASGAATTTTMNGGYANHNRSHNNGNKPPTNMSAAEFRRQTQQKVAVMSNQKTKMVMNAHQITNTSSTVLAAATATATATATTVPGVPGRTAMDISPLNHNHNKPDHNHNHNQKKNNKRKFNEMQMMPGATKKTAVKVIADVNPLSEKARKRSKLHHNGNGNGTGTGTGTETKSKSKSNSHSNNDSCDQKESCDVDIDVDDTADLEIVAQAPSAIDCNSANCVKCNECGCVLYSGEFAEETIADCDRNNNQTFLSTKQIFGCDTAADCIWSSTLGICCLPKKCFNVNDKNNKNNKNNKNKCQNDIGLHVIAISKKERWPLIGYVLLFTNNVTLDKMMYKI